MKKVIFLALAVLGVYGNLQAQVYETLVGVLKYHELEQQIYNSNGRVIELRRFDDWMVIVKYEIK